MTLLCIPGLGTDCTVFSELLNHICYDNLISLNFEDEIIKGCGSLSVYADKLIQKYNLNEIDGDIIILGFSLGGLVGVELSRKIKHKKLFLLSSIKVRQEVPGIFYVARKIQIYRFVPLWFSRNIVPLLGRISGEMDLNGYKLYKKMLKGWTFNKFFWARKMALNWENTEKPENSIHIHGSRDLIFPFKKSRPDYVIKNGTHNMVLTRAADIAAILNEELNSFHPEKIVI
jgi:hypothetical protein